MNDLNDPATYLRIDGQHIGDLLRAMPEHAAAGYAAGRLLSFNAHTGQIVLTGEGADAVAAQLAQAYALLHAAHQVSVHNDASQPMSAQATVISSRAFDTTSAPPAHARVAWMTLAFIGALETAGVLPAQAETVAETVALLRAGVAQFGADSPAHRNSSKRVAGQFVDRLPVIYASGLMWPAALTWKRQLNRMAQMLAAVEQVPAFVDAGIDALVQAPEIWRRSIMIALRCGHDSARNAALLDHTRTALLEAGINQDTITARGNSALAQLMHMVQYGDWVSYHTAIMKGLDPAHTPMADAFAAALQEAA
jgi:hypothetical protein